MFPYCIHDDSEEATQETGDLLSKRQRRRHRLDVNAPSNADQQREGGST
jgi:hypothetical protein